MSNFLCDKKRKSIRFTSNDVARSGVTMRCVNDRTSSQINGVDGTHFISETKVKNRIFFFSFFSSSSSWRTCIRHREYCKHRLNHYQPRINYHWFFHHHLKPCTNRVPGVSIEQIEETSSETNTDRSKIETNPFVPTDDHGAHRQAHSTVLEDHVGQNFRCCSNWNLLFVSQFVNSTVARQNAFPKGAIGSATSHRSEKIRIDFNNFFNFARSWKSKDESFGEKISEKKTKAFLLPMKPPAVARLSTATITPLRNLKAKVVVPLRNWILTRSTCSLTIFMYFAG